MNPAPYVGQVRRTLNRGDDENREQGRGGQTEQQRYRQPLEDRIVRMTAAPIIAASAVSRIGLKRIEPASMRMSVNGRHGCRHGG